MNSADLVNRYGDQLAAVTIAWAIWKKTHDYKSAAMSCCDQSRALFRSLDRLEEIILEAGEQSCH